MPGSEIKYARYMGRICVVDRYAVSSPLELSFAGNIVFLIVFATLLQPQIFLAFKHCTPSTSVLLILGLLAEIVGYAARVWESLDTSAYTFRYASYVTLMLGPLFTSAAIFHTLARIITLFRGDDGSDGVGTKAKRAWKPRVFTLIFTGMSFVILVLVCVGVGKANYRGSVAPFDEAGNLILAGFIMFLSTQLLFIGTSIFLGLKWKRQSTRGVLNQKYASVYTSTKFKISIAAIVLSMITILIRTIFRIIEHIYLFRGYFSFRPLSVIIRRETFMVLESTMMAIAFLALTVGHPGLGLGQVWKEGGVFGGGKAAGKLGEDDGEAGGEKESNASLESAREAGMMSGAK